MQWIIRKFEGIRLWRSTVEEFGEYDKRFWSIYVYILGLIINDKEYLLNINVSLLIINK